MQAKCEGALDANWNERKRLIDEEFEFRLKIQALLVHRDPTFQDAREQEKACKEALRHNDEEYEALVTRWGHLVAPQ